LAYFVEGDFQYVIYKLTVIKSQTQNRLTP
jgi:hypothetical protein